MFENPISLNNQPVFRVDASGSHILSQNDLIFQSNSAGAQDLSFTYFLQGGAYVNTDTYYTSTIDSEADAFRVNGPAQMTSKVTISDHRIKENVVDIDEVVDLLRPVMYFNEKTKREQLGFIAQEVESVFPFLVSNDEKGYKRLNYTALIPLLVKEVQRLKEKVNELKQPKK
jgi:hypothetical protein